MRRVNAASAILLAFLLIAGMAMLPRVIADISDMLTNEKSGTVSMQTVELDFYSDKADEPGYMMRKLALEQRMNTIPIKPEQAKMTEEEVQIAAVDGMAPYIEAKMFSWFEYSFCSTEPYLCIDPEDKNNNTIFWGVSFTAESKPYRNLFLHIDDETGKILYINYGTDGPDMYTYYYPENQRLLMEGFTESFLLPLNLVSDHLGDYKNLVSQNITERKLTEEVTCLQYTFEDKQYGIINVEFYITPAGFWVNYPVS